MTAGDSKDHDKKRQLRLQPHAKWTEKLIALYQDKLSEEESERVEAHLNECVTCAEAYLVYHEAADILYGVPSLAPASDKYRLHSRLQMKKAELLAQDVAAQARERADAPDTRPLEVVDQPAENPPTRTEPPPEPPMQEPPAALSGRLIEQEALETLQGRLVGKELGTYRLTRLLGRGPLAEVYLGRHLRKDTEAAIKILFLPLDERAARSFLQEERSIIGLAHRNILHLFDVDILPNSPAARHEGLPYLVMDYAPGGTLRQRHQPGQRIPLEMVVLYVQQIAAALHYAHDHRRLHLDLKPENLLLGKQEEVLVADFGIATMLRQELAHLVNGSFAGAPLYAAPEQFEERGQVGPASDQYALGVLAYEWLTGSLPFEGDWRALSQQKRTQDPPPLRAKAPALPVELERTVLQALARNPRARFATVGEFATLLEKTALVPASSARLTISRPSARLGVPIRHIKEAELPALKRPPGRAPGVYYGHRGEITALAWSPTRSHLASAGSEDQQVHVWELKTKKYHTVYSGHRGVVRALAWSPKGQYIASVGEDETVHIWDAWTGERLLIYKEHTSRVLSVAWSPDGKYIASGGLDRSIHVWEVNAGTPLTVHIWHVSSAVYALEWSPDGRYLASGEHVGAVQVWEMMTGQFLTSSPARTTGTVQALAWSPDSKRLAFGGKDTVLRIWHALSGGITTYGRGHKFPISALAWFPNGKYIVSGDNQGVMQVWDARNGTSLASRQAHTGRIAALAWVQPDGKQLASGDSNGAGLIWQITST